MATGVSTANFDEVPLVDDLIGNRDGSTARIPAGRLAAQVRSLIGPDVETRALLFADLAWPAGSIGSVWGDTTAAYRGTYRKSGASGAGAWTRIGDLPQQLVRDRAQHTGTQSMRTIDNLLAAISGSGVITLVDVGGTGDRVTASLPGWAADVSLGAQSTVMVQWPAVNDEAAPALQIDGGAVLQLRGPTGGALPAGAMAEGRFYLLSRATFGWRVINDVAGADLSAAVAALTEALNGKAPAGAGITSAERSKLGDIAAQATKNAPDADLKSRANHTGTQAIATVSGLQTALDGKAPTDAGITSAERTKLGNIAAQATKNAPDADLKSRANHTGTQAIGTVAGLQTALDGKAPAGNYASATQGAKADTAVQPAALKALAPREDLDRLGLADVSRPGEDPSRWSSVLTGAPEARPALAVGETAAGDHGAALRIGGAAIPAAGFLTLGPRRAYALEEDRIYQLRLSFARAEASTDPAGDAVEIRLQNLSASKAAVSNVRYGAALTPMPGEGLRTITLTVSRSAELEPDYQPPATARYLTPALRIHGAGQATDIVAIQWEDVTNATLGGADVAGLREDVAQLDQRVESKAATEVVDAIRETAEGEVAERTTMLRASLDGTMVRFKDPSGFVVFEVSLDSLMLMGAAGLTNALGTAFKVRSAEGFVSLELTEDLFELFGRFGITAFEGTGLRLRDREGWVMLDVAADGLYYMGRRIDLLDLAQLMPASVQIAPEIELARTAIRKPSVTSLPRVRKARAGILQGSIFAYAAMLGDSNTMGWASLPSYSHRRRNSYPAVMAKLLREYNATHENGFGRALVEATNYGYYDPRAVIGAGWTPTGPTSLGGEMWVTTGDGSSYSFTPDIPWDVVDVWFACDAAAEVSVGVDGQMVAHSIAGGAIQKVTFTAAQIANQTLRIVGTTVARMIGWNCRNSALPGLSVLNMGRAGWRSDNYANATQWYSPANALAAIAPAVSYVMLGLNDFNQNRSPVGFATSMATLADKIEAAGSDAVLMVPMTPGTPAAERTYPWRQYREAIYDLASDRALPLIDVGLRLGDYATAFAQGFITDELHPNIYGYPEISHLGAALFKS